FNAGSADKLAALHTADAEWVDSDGSIHAGRDAIRGVLAKAFAAQPGRTIDFAVEKTRSVGDVVIIENGSATVTSPDGERSVSACTTVYAKDGDAWRIAQVTETAPDISPSPASQLAALRWLEGTWRGENSKRPVTLKISEAQNGNFLTINYSFGENGSEGTSTEVVGYDAAEDRMRSWTFDSEGGFSEAAWQPDGANWLLVSKSVNPDGTRASSQLEIRPSADGKSFTAEGYNRESGGVPMPKLGPIKFTAVE
ncbi:MAG: YybH family protein, partial [Chthoniobacterales bacterium]